MGKGGSEEGQGVNFCGAACMSAFTFSCVKSQFSIHACMGLYLSNKILFYTIKSVSLMILIWFKLFLYVWTP